MKKIYKLLMIIGIFLICNINYAYAVESVDIENGFTINKELKGQSYGETRKKFSNLANCYQSKEDERIFIIKPSAQFELKKEQALLIKTEIGQLKVSKIHTIKMEQQDKYFIGKHEIQDNTLCYAYIVNVDLYLSGKVSVPSSDIWLLGFIDKKGNYSIKRAYFSNEQMNLEGFEPFKKESQIQEPEDDNESSDIETEDTKKSWITTVWEATKKYLKDNNNSSDKLEDPTGLANEIFNRFELSVKVINIVLLVAIFAISVISLSIMGIKYIINDTVPRRKASSKK